MVEFKGRFDESKSNSANMRAFVKLWWLFAFFSIFMIAIGVIGIVFREDGEDLGYGIFMISVGVLFTPLVLLLSKAVQKALNKSMPVMSPDTTETYQFYPDRLIITQRKQRNGETDCEYEATTNTRYSYLYRVEETRDSYFLRISKMQSHVVYKSDLTQGTLEELNDILASNLGFKFKRKK